MPAKIIYHEGQEIGSHGVIYLKDVDYNNDLYDGKIINKTKSRKAWFKCPLCEKIFPASVDHVKSNSTKSCGCLHNKQAKINGRKTVLDLTNKKVGKLIVLEPTDKRYRGNVIWKCKCECGNIVYLNATDLKRERTKSCGCLKREDITGQTFGYLTAIEYMNKTSSSGSVWKFLCKCGKTTEVGIGAVKSGNTLSCGCKNLSNGELKIKNILEKLNVNYIKEYYIKETNQRFDFYIPKYNCAIEYDGIQHFKPVKFFGGEDYFLQVQEWDNTKNKYCKNNNINLIRIPYYDDKILNEKYIIERLGDVNG